jgi:hypothetical protein
MTCSIFSASIGTSAILASLVKQKNKGHNAKVRRRTGYIYRLYVGLVPST